MRKLVLKMSMSVDGFVAGPNGEIDWLLRTMSASGAKWVEETLWDAGVHVMGSRTFHDMASYWPTSSNPLAAAMNEIPKVVFSRKGMVETKSASLTTQALKDSRRIDGENGITSSHISNTEDSWRNAKVEKDLIDGINALKKEDGKFILAHGGAGFAQELVKYGLIDEYRLVIHPVILGKGLPLFSSASHQINLQLKSSTPFDIGTLANVYVPS